MEKTSVQLYDLDFLENITEIMSKSSPHSLLLFSWEKRPPERLKFYPGSKQP